MPALNVNFELKTPLPYCANNELFFTCEVIAAYSIRWVHAAFGHITFNGNSRTEVKTININDRVFAELTMRVNNIDGLFNLTSSLTFYPPLLNLNSTNLNQTILMCIGNGIAGTVAKSLTLSFLGEELSL